MDIKCKQDSLVYDSPVYSALTGREDSAEAVVPDTMPDIGSILDADATVYVRDTSVSDGKIQLDGEIHGTVLYVGEDGTDIRRMELRMPFSLVVDHESIRAEDRPMVEVRPRSVIARAVNPRKVALSVETAARVTLYRREALEIPTGAESAELQILMGEAGIGIIAGVERKSFVVSEEIAFPAASPALETMLYHRVSASVEDRKSVGGKMILQGSVGLELLYLGEDAAEPRLERFTVPFSQIMDIPEDAAGEAEIVLLPDACYVEPVPGAYGAGTVHMEVHLLAQAAFRAQRDIRYIADAYSVHSAYTLFTKTAQLSGPSRALALRETLRQTIDTPETPAELLYGYARLSLPELRDGTVALPLSVHAVYRTERGELAGVTKHLEAVFPAEIPEGQEVFLSSPTAGEPFFSVSGGALEVRLPLEVRAVVSDRETLTFVSGIQVEEGTALCGSGASLTLVRWTEQSLWSLAKKYGSTEELIRAANPSAGAGELLLIPRAR